MNTGTLARAMPAKVSVSVRPTVTAGLANDVDDGEEVRRPDPGRDSDRADGARAGADAPEITSSRPTVATTSPSQRPPPRARASTTLPGGQSEHQVGDQRPDAPRRAIWATT